MYSNDPVLFFIGIGMAIFTIGFLNLTYWYVNGKKDFARQRLVTIDFGTTPDKDILDRPFLERTLGGMVFWLTRVINNSTPRKLHELLGKLVERAGNPRGLTGSKFLLLQIICGIGVSALTWTSFDLLGMTGGSKFLLSLVLGLLAIYMPWFLMAREITYRKKEIQKSLPDIMDLLVICVEAGMAFDQALHKIVERYKGAVAQEFQRAIREIQLGKQRKDALKLMAERVDVDALSTLVNAIVQSEQLGVSLGQVLRLQSDVLREQRQRQIEERAMKAPIKMLFPTIMFIFPCIFVIILGPAIISIMKAL